MSNDIKSQTTFLPQGRSCNQFFGKVTCIYCLFVQLKSLVDIKNVFLKRDLAKKAAEMATSITIVL